MRKLTIILLAVSLFISSCEEIKEIIPTETSFTMTYDGVTYTEAEEQSLNVVSGAMAVQGAGTEELLLTITGIGDDGTTMDICGDPDNCDNLCTVMLDFGAADGKEGLVATQGTVKRTGKTIEINVTGINTALETKTISATITVASILDI